MTTETALVDVAIDSGVGVLTMSSPPANALSYELVAQLDTALTAALADGAVVIVLASDVPRFFAAGADLKLLAEASPDDFGDYLATLRAFIERIGSLAQPTVASIGGMALGGGLELALACTFRIAAVDALLGVPEIKLGLLPGAGGTQRLPRLVGRAAALDLLLSGRSVDATEALSIGLIDHAVPISELSEESSKFAHTIAKGPKEAITAILRCVDTSADTTLSEGLEIERRSVQSLFATDDAREGISAFIQKRPATFR